MRLIQALPLTVFMATYRITASWKTAFTSAALATVCAYAIALSRRHSLDRFLMGANLFLVAGAVGFVFNVQPLLEIYASLQQTMLFVSLFVVGAASSLSKNDFVNVTSAEPRTVRKFSLALVAATGVAIAVSLYFHSNMILSVVVPYLALIGLRFAFVAKLESELKHMASVPQQSQVRQSV